MRRAAAPDRSCRLLRHSDEFTALVRGIRYVDRALGSQAKVPGPAELVNLRAKSKGMYAARDPAADTVLTEGDILMVRPATAVGPEAYVEWLGALRPHALKAGHPIVSVRYSGARFARYELGQNAKSGRTAALGVELHPGEIALSQHRG